MTLLPQKLAILPCLSDMRTQNTTVEEINIQEVIQGYIATFEEDEKNIWSLNG